jgi:uncharacterized protein YwbE
MNLHIITLGNKSRLSLSRAIGCIVLGAAAMYLLDPLQGRRRRAVFRDQLRSRVRRAQRHSLKISQGLRNRGRGLIAESFHLFEEDNPTNEVLRARICSRIGHVVSHPHAIAVRVDDGQVTLQGQILRDEVSRLLVAVRRIPGVKDINARLDVHNDASDAPALQGGRERSKAMS